MRSFETEREQRQVALELGKQQILAAAQQKQDYRDAVMLIEESVARLKTMVTAQENVLANGEMMYWQCAEDRPKGATPPALWHVICSSISRHCDPRLDTHHLLSISVKFWHLMIVYR